MKHAYLLAVVGLAASCSGETKKADRQAPAPAPASAAPAAIPAPRVPSPEEQATAVLRVEKAMAEITVEAQRAAANAAEGGDVQTARAQAIEQARNAGVLGSAALTPGGQFPTLTGTGDIDLDDENAMGGLIGNTDFAPPAGFGGLGQRGDGVGGGGANPGTLGLGTYGTLGHGSGTDTGDVPGDGRGGLSGRSRHGPQVKLGAPTCSGDLAVAVVRRFVRRQSARLTYCYEKSLLAQPTLAGNVDAKFTIATDGTVANASADGVAGEVALCMADALRRIEFPRPAGGIVTCSQTFVATP